MTTLPPPTRRRTTALLAAVLVTGAIGARSALASSGGEKKEEKKDEKKDEKKGEGGTPGAVVTGAPGGPMFYDLPDIMVNIDSEGRAPAFLKTKIALQVARAEDANVIQGYLPRILDEAQLYLREIRLSTLKNPKTLERLRLEMLARARRVVRPIKVNDLLFREFLVQ